MKAWYRNIPSYRFKNLSSKNLYLLNDKSYFYWEKNNKK